eukprot:363948-Chlamydomonas_euryale.AAC.3
MPQVWRGVAYGLSSSHARSLGHDAAVHAHEPLTHAARAPSARASLRRVHHIESQLSFGRCANLRAPGCWQRTRSDRAMAAMLGTARAGALATGARPAPMRPALATSGSSRVAAQSLPGGCSPSWRPAPGARCRRGDSPWRDVPPRKHAPALCRFSIQHIFKPGYLTNCSARAGRVPLSRQVPTMPQLPKRADRRVRWPQLP